MNDNPQQGKLLPPTSEAVSTHDAITLSINSLAREFDCSREFMRKIIDGHSIKPSRLAAGFVLYRLRDVLAAWRQPLNSDPDKMRPHDRLAHLKAEEAQLRINEKRGKLLRADDVEFTWARIINLIVLEFEILPDELERDCGLSWVESEYVEKKINLMRERLYAKLKARPNEAKSEEAPSRNVTRDIEEPVRD